MDNPHPPNIAALNSWTQVFNREHTVVSTFRQIPEAENTQASVSMIGSPWMFALVQVKCYSKTLHV